MGLHKTIEQLLLSEGGNNLGTIIDELLRDSSPKKFGIAVTIEAMHKRASCAVG
jgi:hypothetical protein